MSVSFDGPVTREVAESPHPGVLRAQEAARRELEGKRAAMKNIGSIQNKTGEAAKNAYLLNHVMEDRLIQIFEKAGVLMRQPASSDEAGWETYITELDKFTSSSGGKDLVDCLRRGWEPITIFGSRRKSLMIIFRIPDEPNVLCAKNFNLEDDESDD